MLNRAYEYVTDSNIFRLYGSSADKATFQKMLKMILKSRTGRDLICHIGDISEKKGLPVVLKMMRFKDNTLGSCDSHLNVKIVNPCWKECFDMPTEQAIFQQTITLVHELGHVLQFLKQEDRLNDVLPIKDRFYGQVWMEAEADLWARDVEMDLARIYPKLTQNMSLLKTRFKSRSDFVRSFFIKGQNYDWMTSAVDVVISKLMNAKKIVLPNRVSRFYFPRLMNQRFRRMRLPLTYQDMPFDDCFWVSKLEGGVEMIHNKDKYALIQQDGQLMALGDQEVKPAVVKCFDPKSAECLSVASVQMPTLFHSSGTTQQCHQLPGKIFALNNQQINALVWQSDRFGG